MIDSKLRIFLLFVLLLNVVVITALRFSSAFYIYIKRRKRVKGANKIIFIARGENSSPLVECGSRITLCIYEFSTYYSM